MGPPRAIERGRDRVGELLTRGRGSSPAVRRLYSSVTGAVKSSPSGGTEPAVAFCRACSGERAPGITVVTPSSWATEASAARAGERSGEAARAENSLAARTPSSKSTPEKVSPRSKDCWRRRDAGGSVRSCQDASPSTLPCVRLVSDLRLTPRVAAAALRFRGQGPPHPRPVLRDTRRGLRAEGRTSQMRPWSVHRRAPLAPAGPPRPTAAGLRRATCTPRLP